MLAYSFEVCVHIYFLAQNVAQGNVHSSVHIYGVKISKPSYSFADLHLSRSVPRRWNHVQFPHGLLRSHDKKMVHSDEMLRRL